MELVLAVVGTILTAALVSGFTRLHPLVPMAVLALLWAAMFGLMMMAFAVEAWPLGAALAFAAGLATAGIGSFLGRLVRASRERHRAGVWPNVGVKP